MRCLIFYSQIHRTVYLKVFLVMEINIFIESPLSVPALCLLVGTPGPVLSLRKCTSGEGDDMGSQEKVYSLGKSVVLGSFLPITKACTLAF